MDISIIYFEKNDVIAVQSSILLLWRRKMGQVSYSASKAGVVGVTLPIARDFSRELIRVNTILPGVFNASLLHAALDNVKVALVASVPNPSRLGEPAEYASLAFEMCRNGYFNGEDVRLDRAICMALR